MLEEQDAELYRWLVALEERTGYPILVNTSLNRGGEPIVEEPAQALDMFLCRPEIDVLLVGPWWVERANPLEVLASEVFRLGKNVFLTTRFDAGQPAFNVTNGVRTWRISRSMFFALNALGTEAMTLSSILESSKSDERSMPQIYEFILHEIIQR